MQSESFIVKVQWPRETNTEPRALVYNEDRSYFVFVPCTSALRAMMGGHDKVFFRVHLVDGEMRFERRIGDQGW